MSRIKVTPFLKQSFPHDPTSFCQGIVVHDGQLYESCGWYGESRLQISSWPPEASHAVRRFPLTNIEFGEDLVILGAKQQIVQGTWREGYAIVWSLKPLERQRTIICEQPEIWGLCSVDDDRLFSSHGESWLCSRTSTFHPVGQRDVTYRGKKLGPLNALSYSSGLVWANIYPTADIAAIDVRDGTAILILDCAELMPDELDEEEGEVLNGIAHTSNGAELLVTGKRWPVMYTIDLAGLLKAHG